MERAIAPVPAPSWSTPLKVALLPSVATVNVAAVLLPFSTVPAPVKSSTALLKPLSCTLAFVGTLNGEFGENALAAPARRMPLTVVTPP